jgi:hypothetical protein
MEHAWLPSPSTFLSFRSCALVVALGLLGGCVPARHFRALGTTNAPMPGDCELIERCDYDDSREQARCEMADLSVPEAGALAVCGDLSVGG